MSKLIDCLKLNKNSCFPIWFMRQAGRYLPEFREIRKKNTNFIKLCLNPKLSTEITLQPINRYNLDAAIIFSDILLVPYALGQNVNFKGSEGPTLSEINIEEFLKDHSDNFINIMKPVYDAINTTREKLHHDKSLICFVGAPWTLSLYMLNLKNNTEEIIKNSSKIKQLITHLEKYLKKHILKQYNSGANCVQIFDSWAGLLPEKLIEEFCYKPNKSLVDFCKKNKIPVICFPKGLKKKYKEFKSTVKPNGINIDYEVDPVWARDNLSDVCLQGGMDPKTLLKSDKEILFEVDKYLEVFKNSPYIFNLGHGILPETNPDKIKMIIQRVEKKR